MTKTHRTTEEEMEGPISFWRYKEQESNLILPEHDDDDDDEQYIIYKTKTFRESGTVHSAWFTGSNTGVSKRFVS